MFYCVTVTESKIASQGAKTTEITKEKTDEISQRGFSKAHPLGKVTGK
jgi:hypothetical protein